MAYFVIIKINKIIYKLQSLNFNDYMSYNVKVNKVKKIIFHLYNT